MFPHRHNYNPTDSIRLQSTSPTLRTHHSQHRIYNQNSIVKDKELTLKSSTENPEEVTIDAQDSDRVMEIATGINNVPL